MRLPRLFRILVIDDKVAADQEIQEGIRNVLTCLAYRAEQGGQIEHVDVVFAGTAEKGIQKWQDEVFDLALFDSKFGSEIKTEGERVSGFLDYYAQYRGVLTYQVTRSLLSPDENYAYRRGTSHVYVWTSLDHADVSRILQGAVDIAAQKARKERKVTDAAEPTDPTGWYLAKLYRAPAAAPGMTTSAMQKAQEDGDKQVFVSLWRAVSRSVDTAIAVDDFSGEQVTERFITLYKIRETLPVLCRKPFQTPLVDGYLFRSASPMPFVTCLREGGKSEPSLYFTLRQPGSGGDSADFCLENGKEPNFVHVGPASRDINRPLAAAVRKLYCDPHGRQSADDPDEHATPLATDAQLDLLYRQRREDGPNMETLPRRVSAKLFTPSPKKLRTYADGAGIEAAATPLTGVSTVGLPDARAVLLQKAKSLLQGPFDRVVLKTSYLNDPVEGGRAATECVRWPALQAQSHHRTRCLRSVGHPRTLWNTGVTALEMFTPGMLNGFLKDCMGLEHRETFGDRCERLIVSLGSKYPKARGVSACYRTDPGTAALHGEVFTNDLVNKVWTPLFEQVFGKEANGYFPVVEINVRHYLRENVEFYIGGDEYLSPSTLWDRSPGAYREALAEFRQWLVALHQVGTTFGKRLILKFPFRTDIFAFIQEVFTFCLLNEPSPRGSGIQGICLINAFKSGVCETERADPFSPAWYSLSHVWGDAGGREVKYQMSGEMLNASRNMLLYRLLEGREHTDGTKRRLKDLELHVGGGIVCQDDLSFCQDPSKFRTGSPQFTPVSVQIGTWALLNLRLADKLPTACMIDTPASRPFRVQAVANCDGTTCGTCVRTSCAGKAISVKNGRIWVNQADCVGCGQCLSDCRDGVFSKSTTASSSSGPRADSLVNSRRKKIPNICPERCIGCGRCVRACEERQRERHGDAAQGLLESATRASAGGKKSRYARPREGGNIRDQCLECKACHEACQHEAISFADPLILPRISYLLHEQCTGCGKCSRSFYCDTFLDRRGGNCHPVMDPRNCTGCGLCAQMCPNGALQMFKPVHLAVLISGRGERSDLFKALQIPHLAYEPTQDLQLFGSWIHLDVFHTAKNLLEDTTIFQRDELVKWAIDLWQHRLIHDRLPDDAGFEEDARWKNCVGVSPPSSDEVLKSQSTMRLVQDGITRHASTIADSLLRNVKMSGLGPSVATRAFVWSQLIWSDPGQILWESPIIVVRTHAKSESREVAKHCWPRSPGAVRDALMALLGDRFYVLSDWVVLHRGEVMPTKYECRDEVGPLMLTLTEHDITRYAASGLGRGRLLGLDLRACPGMLTSGGEELDANRLMSVSGLPWHRLINVPCVRVIESEVTKRMAAIKELRA